MTFRLTITHALLPSVLSVASCSNPRPQAPVPCSSPLFEFFAFLRGNFLRLALLLSVISVTSCSIPHPQKGGHAITAPKPGGGLEQSLAQGDNPSQPSRQDQEHIIIRTYTVPAGSRLEQPGLAPTQSPNVPVSYSPSPSHGLVVPSSRSPVVSSAPSPSQSPGVLASQSPCLILSAPMLITEREETRAKSELGAAQKDTSRDIAAKLSSLKGIVWVGLLLFLSGLASLVYPPLKLLVASTTTSVSMVAGGLALMTLPSVIVGHELLILSVVALAVGAWFLAHRHGKLSGQLSALLSPASASPASAPSVPSVPLVPLVPSVPSASRVNPVNPLPATAPPESPNAPGS